MAYLHPKEKAKEFASQAFARLQKEGLVPSPENYELMFVYYSGSNPALRRAMDLATEKNSLDEEVCGQIFHEFLSGSREDETVRQAGEQIKKTIEDVNGAVMSVKELTNEYSKNLETVNDQLQEDISKDEVHEIINHVISDTREIMQQNDRLEKLLGTSTQAIEELKKDLEIARKEALTDALTGLLNRKGFEREVEQILRQAKKDENYNFVLILSDIDHFKNFNDTFGHLVGDQVLKLVAKTLKDTLKGRDVVVRYGGEEFAVILTECDLDVGLRVAEVIRQEVAKKDVINRVTGEKIAKITLSAGVAQFVKDEDIDSLIARADSALYGAKHNGRNQVAAASEKTKAKAKS